MFAAIMKEVGRVVGRHRARDAAWYNEVSSPASTLHIVVESASWTPITGP
jgi:hypothetical protein